jgi:antitoxin ParD1/3/4
MQTMNVSLTPELIKIVQDKVASGLYGNASEVIREAIRNMDELDELVYQTKLDRLRTALEPGIKAIEAGDFAEFSLEELNRELDEELDSESR